LGKRGRPVITIIVAVLNSQATLVKCIQSIVDQTWPEKELIVIDGGSTDNSLSILHKFSKHIACLESQPDRGIYHAWNKGLRNANGEWVCFLGSDDFFWSPSVLYDLVPHLEKAEEQGTRVVYGQVARLDHQGNVKESLGKPWDTIAWQMNHGMPKNMPHPGLMHHCSLFQTHGLFDETFRISGDYEMLLRELKTGKALYVNNVLTVGSQMGGIADTSGLLTHREVARARKKHNLSGWSWVWLMVYMRTFLLEQWGKIIK